MARIVMQFVIVFIVGVLQFIAVGSNPNPHTHRASSSSSSSSSGNSKLTREREEDGAYSPRDKDHYVEGDHRSEFDHEAVLGSRDEAEEFDHLSPEEAKHRLQLIVEKMDKNRDGYVDDEELTNWVIRSFRLLSEEESEERLEDADANDDGKVTWEEYTAEAYGIGESSESDPEHFADEQKMLQEDEELFKAADVNGDEILEKSEFLAFTHPDEHEHMLPIIYKRTMDDKDVNSDGMISFQEFVGSEGIRHDKDWVLAEKDRFESEFDRNSDGRLDKDEVLLWIMPNNRFSAQQEAQHLIDSADDDLDGALNLKEILDHHDVFVGSEVTDFGHHLHNTQKFTDEL